MKRGVTLLVKVTVCSMASSLLLPLPVFSEETQNAEKARSTAEEANESGAKSTEDFAKIKDEDTAGQEGGTETADTETAKSREEATLGGGMRNFEELAKNAAQIENGRLAVSMALSAGDAEVSSGMEISFTNGNISVDMVYVSVPLSDGTSFEIVSEDVMRIFGKEAYLSSEFLKDIGAGLESKAADEGEKQSRPASIPDGAWIKIEGTHIQQGAFEGWDKVFDGLTEAHDSGIYTLNLGNEEIMGIFRKLETMMEGGAFEKGEPFKAEDLVGKYADAIIEGLRIADAGAVTQKQKKALHEKLQQSPASLLYGYLDGEELADRFEYAAEKGLEVTVSVSAGKDAAAGTYALEATMQEYIPQELEDEWGVDLVPGNYEENIYVSFLASIEPAEEPAEIEKPEDDAVIMLEDLLKKWAADGAFGTSF